MKIVIAPDKFKGSLSSFEVCRAIEAGLMNASGLFNITKLPMADGGDGLSDVLAHYINAQWQTATVQDPLGRPIEAKWLLSSDGEISFIEMAKASGLQLLKPGEYNPLLTSTFGTGQLIDVAIKTGAKNIIVGIGGSATNDCGIGMAAALGYRFTGYDGRDVSPIGENLLHVKKIEVDKKRNLQNINFKIACDVKNLLFGEAGASRVYAPQKGADRFMVEELEKGMIHFASVIKNDLGIDVSQVNGGGAAGGLGAGCVAFLNADLISGIDLVAQITNLEEHIKNCDVVITGEGKIDEQSLDGKVISGIATLAKKYRKRLIAVCGSSETELSRLKEAGVEKVYSIINKSINLSRAMAEAEMLLKDLSFDIGKDLAINRM